MTRFFDDRQLSYLLQVRGLCGNRFRSDIALRNIDWKKEHVDKMNDIAGDFYRRAVEKGLNQREP